MITNNVNNINTNNSITLGCMREKEQRKEFPNNSEGGTGATRRHHFLEATLRGHLRAMSSPNKTAMGGAIARRALVKAVESA